MKKKSNKAGSDLAITYNTPIPPSETFIRQHVEGLAPGRTLGLVFGNPPKEQVLEHVVLNNSRANKSFLVRKASGLVTLLRTGTKMSPDKASEDRAVAMLGKHGCTTIFAEYGPNGCAVRHIARRAGARLFVHFHGYDASSLLNQKGIKREYAHLFRQAAGIITPSRFLAKRLEEIGCPGGLLHVVPCGVDTKLFLPAKECSFSKRVVAIGRLTPKKAPLHTIEAFAKTCKDHPDARLEMLGDGPLMANCHDLVKRLNMENRITLQGAQPHDKVLELLHSADLFVQHSVTAPDGDMEGLPVAVMEAMAIGLPVVSTRHSGIPEAVEHGVTGYLVNEHDVDAMAARMSELLSNPDLCREMGRAGRQRAVELFDREKSLTRLREVLDLI